MLHDFREKLSGNTLKKIKSIQSEEPNSRTEIDEIKKSMNLFGSLDEENGSD